MIIGASLTCAHRAPPSVLPLELRENRRIESHTISVPLLHTRECRAGIKRRKDRVPDFAAQQLRLFFTMISITFLQHALASPAPAGLGPPRRAPSARARAPRISRGTAAHAPLLPPGLKQNEKGVGSTTPPFDSASLRCASVCKSGNVCGVRLRELDESDRMTMLEPAGGL